MNKHVKLAFVTAPFLAIGGYIAAGYFLDKKVKEDRLLTLTLEAPCDLTTSPCVLLAKGLSLELSIVGATPEVKSSYPMDSITLSLLDTAGKESVHRLIPQESFRLWKAASESNVVSNGQKLSDVRIAAVVENLTYLHEFKPNN